MMNAPLQALHVLRKDVRQGRWLLAGYVLLLIVAGLRAYTESEAAGPAVATFLVPLVGGLLIALAVQSDPPVSEGAHWVTLPLEPGAVAAAKFALLAAVTFLALAAHAVALMKFGLPAGDFLRLLSDALLVYLLGLTVAGAAAALTEDLRGFVLAVLSGLVAGTLLFALAGIDTTVALAGSGIPKNALHLLAVGAAGMLLVLQYRRRILRAGMLPAVAVCTVAALVMAIGTDRTPQPRWTDPAGAATPGAADPAPQLRAWTSALPRGAPVLIIEVVGGSPGYEYELRQHVLHVQHDDRIESVSLGVDWPLPLSSLRPDSRSTLPLPRGTASDLIPLEDVQVRLTGTLLVTRHEHVHSLPMAAGSEVSLPGYRIRIDSTAPSESLIRVSTETVYQDALWDGRASESLGFTLRTPAGEAIPLTARSGGLTIQPLLLGSAKVRRRQFDLAPDTDLQSLPDRAELGVYLRRRVATRPINIPVAHRQP